MVTLQRPSHLWIGGAVRPWEEGVFHVGSEALVRGLNVFEGLKGYWQPDGRFGIVALRRHYDRLLRSARLLRIPVNEDYAAFVDAHEQLLATLLDPAHETWIRATIFVEEGHWGLDTVSNLVLTAYHQPRGVPADLTVGVSGWRRAADPALPPRIKTPANYLVGRMARIEGRGYGHGEMILLNGAGRVAEATGACVLMVAGGVVVTPPPYEGALESITVDLVEAMAEDLGIGFVRRPIDHSELKLAEEVAVCGTLAELPRVTAIDGLAVEGWDVLDRVRTRLMDALTGRDPHPAVAHHLITG